MKIEELQARVGEAIGTSDWFDVAQDRIDRFADATEDHQYIHVDPEAAKDSPFGQTIAHGFLTLSLLAPSLDTGLPEIEGVSMTVNYGFDKVRFIAPVKSGSRVRAQYTLDGLEEKRPGQWQLNLGISVEIEGEDKPALIAQWILMKMIG